MYDYLEIYGEKGEKVVATFWNDKWASVAQKVSGFFTVMSADQIRCVISVDKAWLSCLAVRNKERNQEFSFGHY